MNLIKLLYEHMLGDPSDKSKAVVAPQQSTPVQPQQTEAAPQAPMSVLNFDTAKNAYHSTRVICDSFGLSLEEKNTICACIYQESRFLNYRAPSIPTTHRNLREDGTVGSTDWGIVQVNDRFHIGPHLDFVSVPYVMGNPAKCVEWMVKMFKAGRLSMWCSYSSGAYRQWLLPTSPMWALNN